MSLITYLLLDLYVFASIWQVRRNMIMQVEKPDYSLAGIFFVIFIFLGLFQLILCIAVRFSTEGQVCSGDYIESYDHDYYKMKGYYMIYEGNFVVGVLIYEILSFLLVLLTFYNVN